MRYSLRNSLCAKDTFGNKIYFIDGKKYLGKMKKRSPYNISQLILMVEGDDFLEIEKFKIMSNKIIFTVQELENTVANNKNHGK